MKKALTIFALLISGVAMGQETKTLEFISEYVTPDTTGKICKERGHVSPGVGMSTLMWCPPYQIDYPDSTVMVYPACNTTSYVCSRCGETVSDKGKESRVVTWRRPIEEIDITGLEQHHLISDKKEPTIKFHLANGNTSETDVKLLTFQMLLDYETYCLKDTIKATQYDYKSEFLILYGTFGAVVTEKQMEKRGYKYVSGYFHGTNPFKLDYYFVKEATFKGFIQWYKEKVK